MFVMNTLRNLVLRLNYKQNLDLRNLPKSGAVPTIFNFDPTQPCSTREKRKGPAVLKEGGNICYIKLFKDKFSLKGTIKWLTKGER